MEDRIVNIGDTYGFRKSSFFIYKKFSINSFEMIIVSKGYHRKTNKLRRIISSYSFSKEQIDKFYNKSIILIEKKPWRIGQ